MAVGEIRWSSAGKKVERFERTPLPNNDYDLKLNAAEVTQEKGDKPGQVPYINVPFQALGTATGDSGKDRKVLHRLFLHLSPGKDGKVMLERPGGALDLAKAFGEDVSFSGIEVPYQKYDKSGNRVGEMTRIAIANPAEVLKWVKAHDGAVARAHVKIERSEGYDPKNVVEYFIASADAPESSDEQYEMEDDDDEDQATDLEEEAPKTKKRK